MKPASFTPLVAVLLVQCVTAPPQRQDAPVCAKDALRVTEAPRVSPPLRQMNTWSANLPSGDATRVLLSQEAIQALNARNRDASRAAYQDVLDETLRAHGELRQAREALW